MPSASLASWQNDRMLRLNEVDAHCAAIVGMLPPNLIFLDETLRGFVLHLSAHFQGFCRDLYTECSQICIGSMPAGLQPTAQSQFSAELALEKGNPNRDNIIRDFSRFGFQLKSRPAFAATAHDIVSLGHLNHWRNKAAHQKNQAPGGGSPAVLTLPVLRDWRAACDGLANSLDGIMNTELHRILGIIPW